MKREFLEELGIEKENIDKIMAENGKDIEKAKGELETIETEKENLEEQLEKANETIEEFKGMDIESMKAAAEDYKTKYEESKTEYEKELEKIKFNHTLDKTLAGAKAKNTKAVRALLDLEGLKLNEGKIVGLSEQLERLQEENDFLFKLEDKEDDKPNFTRPNKGGKSKGLTQEEFREMGYLDKIELKKKDPELYEELK